MLPIVEKLLVLQDRDRKLLRLRAEIEASGPQKQLLTQKAAQAQADFDLFKLRSKQIESDRKKLELEVATKQQLVEKCRTGQGNTKKNEEYSAFQHQIDTTQREITPLEDQQLELMEKSDQVGREIQAAEKVAKSLKAEVDKALADIKERDGSLQRDFEAVSAERKGLIGDLDEGLQSRYERLLKTKGENIIVGVTNSICGGCHMKLTMQTFLSAKAKTDIVTCPSCSRMLYYTRDMED
ncbi:MAG: hypothetical protein EXS36_16590 [Pedosphaera sp.]|nr:hypothetical protein [Pedosphaera sp.]